MAASTGASIGVVIADDHPLMRSGIRATLQDDPDICVVGEASDGLEVQTLCRRLEPHVLILDLSMPGPSFLETLASLKSAVPTTSVLVLTAFDDSVHIRSLVRAGIAGYMLKDEVPDALISAVRTVRQGGTWFSRTVFSKLQEVGQDGALQELTDRERDVLTLVAHGRDNGDIAHELGLAEQTIRNYVSRIYEKVGLHSRVELAVWARDLGLATTPTI